MSRIVFCLLLILLPSQFLSAQESAAMRAFAAGDFVSAVQLYQVAIVTANDVGLVESLTASMNRAKSCALLLQRANRDY